MVVVDLADCHLSQLGLFAPFTNRTVFVTLVVCAVAVSGAVFIIMAMYTPFGGVMKISSLPLRDASHPDDALNVADPCGVQWAFFDK